MKKIMLVLCISLLFGLLAWFPLVHAQGSAPTVVPPVPADVLPAPVEQRPLLIAADSGPAWEFLDAAVPPAGASAGTGVISGTITGAATGQPIAASSIDFNLEGDGSLTTAVLAHLRTESDPDPVRTLHYNLGFNPASLDPAVAIDTISLAVIEQLFLGLVDLDDDTGEVRPELASSWDVSDDGTVYTFTLRSDATWTDGRAVTAHDARYGILRSLNPATGATYASSLFLIRNAQAYNTGVITDTSQVGVTALDDTHLRIELEHAAAYVLSLLSLSTARPQPRWAIEGSGIGWTAPENIVSNGAYVLAAWDYNDSILLEKNPTYYDAARVPIQRVKMHMVDANLAWDMYRNGELQTVEVPTGITVDPALLPEVHSQAQAWTYYLGFSVAQSPFDQVLVRKAFSAATNRQGVIDEVLRGPQQPALTFTAPGVFGHVDGFAEGVGIPYDPVRARQWLADAGYPDGQGLPAITLWYYTEGNHQPIMEYLQQGWAAALGVTVTLQHMGWLAYNSELHRGQFQVWRYAWGADYLDANNFLSDGILRNDYGNWSNAIYESLVSQAARQSDPAVRRELYKQAERILVETDAVMVPIYYYASRVATEPCLQRTYPSAGTFDISAWRWGCTVYLPVIRKD